MRVCCRCATRLRVLRLARSGIKKSLAERGSCRINRGQGVPGAVPGAAVAAVGVAEEVPLQGVEAAEVEVPQAAGAAAGAPRRSAPAVRRKARSG